MTALIILVNAIMKLRDPQKMGNSSYQLSDYQLLKRSVKTLSTYSRLSVMSIKRNISIADQMNFETKMPYIFLEVKTVFLSMVIF
jgi:hypothetical protein